MGKSHSCPDWDGLIISKGDPEMDCCTCKKETKEEKIEKELLISMLSQTIKQLCEMKPEQVKLTNGKIRFRQYLRAEWNDNTLQAIDITIEM